MAAAKMQTLVDFLIDNRLVDDQPYFRAAMAAQLGAYTPPAERNFFAHGAARDPSALYSHEYHWIELARRKHEPNNKAVVSVLLEAFAAFADAPVGFSQAASDGKRALDELARVTKRWAA